MTHSGPFRLTSWQREMPWGCHDLRPWAMPSERKIGEIWFEHEPRLSLLVKLLFTADKLSVQVHPDDADGEPGKTEMWYVLKAEPGARIALGFKEPVSRARLREAALSGEIEDLLRWFPAQAGQAFLTPARTVHALGPGLVLCEIQQNCDTTYRLFDYNRKPARPLHLDRATAIANLGTHPGPATPEPGLEGERRLISCPHFSTQTVTLDGEAVWRGMPGRFYLLVTTAGCGSFIDAEFQAKFRAGEVWMVPPDAREFTIRTEGPAQFLRTCPGV